MVRSDGGLSSKNLVMGFQHMFVMFGATVLVPIITGMDVNIALFASGAGTLLFHVVTKFRVPVYLGSSFAFIPVIIAIASAPGGSFAKACGGIFVAGLMYVVVAVIFRFIDFKIIHAILPPHVTGVMIILIGLILAPVAVKNANGTNAPDLVKQIGAAGCWGLALGTFAAGVFVKIFMERMGLRFLSSLPVLLALVIGYLASLVCGVVSMEPIRMAGWFGLPHFFLPEFDITAISIAVPVAIVTMVEHFGDILAIGNVVGKDFIREPGIHRTLIGDGLATSLSALMGGPANTTYSENTGAVALTGNYHPIVMEIAAVSAMILSVVPKFGAVISSIPVPVIGGISILLFGMISAVGIKTMVDNRVDLHDPKIMIVSAAMLVLGLGGAELALGSLILSGLGLAAIAGILLNAVLSIGEAKCNRNAA